MKRRLLCLLLAALLTAGLTGCRGTQRRSVTYTDGFDTVTTLTAYGISQAEFTAGAERLHEKLLEYHRLYDIYTDYAGIANLKTLNDRAGGEPVALSAPVLELLEYGLQAYRDTDGRVNILFGAVLELWHACRQQAQQQPETAALPEPTALRAAAAHTDPACLVIDRAAGTARITDAKARVDVGAVAKGYAVERLAEFARQELGWRWVLINVGGNIRAVGGKGAADRPFTIGLQNPDTDSAKAYVATVSLPEGAVVTSGDYQRYYTVDGQRYAHIIDVDTLYPAARMRAVSVVCADSARADVLSTALFTLSVEAGQRWVEQLPGVEALWVQTDGSLVYSAGFAAYLTEEIG